MTARTTVMVEADVKYNDVYSAKPCFPYNAGLAALSTVVDQTLWPSAMGR